MADGSSFRDKISTVDSTGRRKWIYAFQPKGKLYQKRTILSIFYLLAFFTLPFIYIDGNPVFLFNIPKGIFIIFGKIFLPQDFVLLGIAMLIGLVFIVVFTLVFGRVFCGWVCPQTIFLEMVFRRIEYWIEGPAQKQIINNKNKTNEVRIRKAVKHVIFIVISFIIANTFLAYIIGVKELGKIISEPVTQHLGGFIALAAFSAIFYFVFAHMRELVCTVACPYGRLQSVLLDKNSVAVAYDYTRGEPRGRRKKGAESASLGDCIDCNMCVNVCPTGIDIRNGLQMECTNCTACIDACNMMMAKTNKPLNLITFASENQLEQKQNNWFNNRVKIYMVFLTALLVLLFYMIFSRSVFDATVIRVPGQLYQQHNDGTISNLYKIKIVSKSMKPLPYRLTVKEEGAVIEYVGKKIDSLYTGKMAEETFFIKLKDTDNLKRRNILHLQILSQDKKVQVKKISFIGKY